MERNTYTCRFAFSYRHGMFEHSSHSLCLTERDVPQTDTVNGDICFHTYFYRSQRRVASLSPRDVKIQNQQILCM